MPARKFKTKKPSVAVRPPLGKDKPAPVTAQTKPKPASASVLSGVQVRQPQPARTNLPSKKHGTTEVAPRRISYRWPGEHQIGQGLIRILEGKDWALYHVLWNEDATDGSEFELWKVLVGDTGPLGKWPTYQVWISEDGRTHTCSCPHGQNRRATKPCRHVDALRKLMSKELI